MNNAEYPILLVPKILKRSEILLVEQHLKSIVRNLQKLPERTPLCVISFLGGVLPGSAILHLEQLNLFGMITRAPSS